MGGWGRPPPPAAPAKGRQIEVSKNFGLLFGVQKKQNKNVQKIMPAYSFTLSHLQMESNFI